MFFFTLRTMFYLPLTLPFFYSLLQNFIMFSPPPPPHLFHIFFHPQKNRSHIDPTLTLDSTFFFSTQLRE